MVCAFFFFFKQKTAYEMRISDWSSDVCSSDLPRPALMSMSWRGNLYRWDGRAGSRPVLGMFLGGAGLADYILYCRHKIYPLGLSNGLSHFLTALAVIFSLLLGIGGKYMPPRARPIQVSLIRE